MTKKKSAGSLISELKRKTRRSYSSEEKIRIIIEGMRGESSIAAPLSQCQINLKLYKHFIYRVFCFYTPLNA